MVDAAVDDDDNVIKVGIIACEMPVEMFLLPLQG